MWMHAYPHAIQRFPGNALFESLLGNEFQSLAYETPAWISFGVVAKPLALSIPF